MPNTLFPAKHTNTHTCMRVGTHMHTQTHKKGNKVRRRLACLLARTLVYTVSPWQKVWWG